MKLKSEKPPQCRESQMRKKKEIKKIKKVPQEKIYIKVRKAHSMIRSWGGIRSAALACVSSLPISRLQNVVPSPCMITT